VNSYRVYFKGLFPNQLGRIFQVKGQSRRVISLFSYSVLFYLGKNNLNNLLKAKKTDFLIRLGSKVMGPTWFITQTIK
jgi:hypothetical protein